MKERGVFVVFIYSHYVDHDHCGTAVAPFENITVLSILVFQ